MTKYIYMGLVIAVVGVFTTFFYRTPPSVPPVHDEQALFGGVSLRIEYATTPETRERGLGGRSEIPEDYGMLFAFPIDDMYGFWMKDMLVSIDIFWLDDKGQVVHIEQNVATSTYPNVFYPPEPVRYVLETVAGFAKKNNITIGTKLSLKNFPIVSE